MELIRSSGGYIDNPKGAVAGFITGVLIGESLPGINKDSMNCGFSPHFHHHRDAVELSIAASVQYINDIRLELTDNQFRQLMGVGRTYAFMVDTTMILRFSLNDMKGHSIEIIEEDSEEKEANQYIIAPFDGERMDASIKTQDLDHFKSSVYTIKGSRKISQLKCLGIPLQNILDTVKTLDEGSNLFLMAAAFPLDETLASEIIALAFAKDIRIHSLQYLGGCVPILPPLKPIRMSGNVSGLFPQPPPTAYESIASATGGATFSFPRNKLTKRANWDIPSRWSQGDGGRILMVSDILTPRDILNPLKSTSKSYTFPIDKSVSELKIAVRSRNSIVTLTKPGSWMPINLPSPGVQYVKIDGGHFITIKAPPTGKWTVTLDGMKDFTLDVFGTSTLHLSSFDFTRIAGRPGHQGYFPISGSPASNTDISATAAMEGDFRSAIFEFRSPSYSGVYPAPLRPGSGTLGDAPKNSFHGVVRLAARKEYHVYVTGTDSAGQPFQRVWPTAVNPS
jgi:hypothetical protein